ncbi:coagulation factor IX-like [Anopheles aquasalis]|uniref:coagulation factor IX-like n=1 Tax=Anopheles aquasalis TaxID=42839 RepID=UPI00215B0D0A|nr:coagulation factor IX-like [Anopheles aquasalis]
MAYKFRQMMCPCGIVHLVSILAYLHPVIAIVGGKDAVKGAYPHMALLGRLASEDTHSAYEWFCGGSLISDRFVLTAAHCACNKMKNAPTIVRLGEHNLKDSQSASRQDFGVQRIVHHPNFQHAYNDISLIELSARVIFNQFIQPACLWSSNEDPVHPLVATGWGSMGYYGEQATVLQHVQIPLVANGPCNQKIVRNRRLRYGILGMQMCAGDVNGGKDTCAGDSGGPLQVLVPVADHKSGRCSSSYYVVGITSNGMICGAADRPGIYSRVSSYVPWINQILDSVRGCCAKKNMKSKLRIDKVARLVVHCVLMFVVTHIHPVIAIVGGEDAVKGEYPHMALLGRPSTGDSDGSGDLAIEWFCGGSLISNRFVLTAAHCAYNKMQNPPTIVRLGEHNLKDSQSPSRQDFGVQRIVHHPNFQHAYNDISLIELSARVIFNQFIQPACLWSSNEDPVHPLVATGWGSMGYYGEQATFLQHVQIPLVANGVCNQRIFPSRRLRYGILGMQMCAGDVNGGKDTCAGDSGGPLQVLVPEADRRSGKCSSFYYVVGVTSNGMICGTVNQPGIYSRVSCYIPWITQILSSDRGDKLVFGDA